MDLIIEGIKVKELLKNLNNNIQVINAVKFKYLYNSSITVFENFYDNFVNKDNRTYLKNPTIDIKEYSNYEQIKQLLVSGLDKSWQVNEDLQKNDLELFKLRPPIFDNFEMLIQPYPEDFEGELTPEMLAWDLEQKMYRYKKL